MLGIIKENQERGISNVVGVIFMIGVVVILSVIILGFGLGFTDLLQKPPQAGVTINSEQNGTNYSATVVVSSLTNAERVTVTGPKSQTNITSVGGHVTLHNLDKGALVIITASNGDNKVVVRKYKVGNG